MSDLISRQAAIEGTKKIPDLTVYAYCSFIEMLSNLPHAKSEIIKCKDCKHRPTAMEADRGIFWGSSLVFPDHLCPCECDDTRFNQYPEDDFYCAHGERKEENE